MDNFIRDKDKLYATRALLNYFGEDGINALPQPVMLEYFSGLRRDMERQISYANSRLEYYETKVVELSNRISEVEGIKVGDVNILKEVTTAFSQQSSVYSSTSYITLNSLINYHPLTDELRTQQLEVRRVKNHISRLEYSIQDINHTSDMLLNISSLVKEIQEFIQYLHRHNISTSYIMSLDLNDLTRLLESGVA